jgi:Mg2+/Co2+ transporter CorB
LNEAPLGLLFGVLFLLVLISAFFSSSETGMMSLNRYRLKHLQKNNHRGAIKAGKLLEQPDRLIGLILIGNNLVNILASAIATVIAIRLYGNAGIAIATLLLTLVILIFAEVTPKTIAAFHPEKIAFPASYILKPLMVLLHPAVWAINQITGGLLRALNVYPQNGDLDHLSSDELRTIVGEAGPHIPKRHQGMLLNILDLENVTVNDIMIPRNDVFGINIDDDEQSILKQLQDCEHTRILLYKEDIDNVIGILHLRNVSRFIYEKGANKEEMVKLAVEPYFVPENTGLHVQLLNFQKEKRRLAIVVDEYGVLLGVVTLEDILEEIVGEFTSNLAGTEDEFKQEDDGSFIVNGTANIRDINRALNWNLPTDGPKTLNGLIMEHLESFPDANVSLQIGPYYIEILSMKNNLIQSARLKSPEETGQLSDQEPAQNQ